MSFDNEASNRDNDAVLDASGTVDECDNCGEDLWLGVPHDCPVSGSVVILEEA